MKKQILRFFEAILALFFLGIFGVAFLPLVWELGGQNRVILVIISTIGILLSFIGIIASIIDFMSLRRRIR